MKRTNRILLVVLVVALVALVAATAVFAKQPHPNTGFDGKWTATDVADGSTLTLRLKLEHNGVTYRARLFDDGASACGVDEVTLKPLHKAMLRGTGTVDASLGSLAIPFVGKCLPNNTHVVLSQTLTYSYDPLTDTLTEVETGNVYSR